MGFNLQIVDDVDSDKDDLNDAVSSLDTVLNCAVRDYYEQMTVVTA